MRSATTTSWSIRTPCPSASTPHRRAPLCDRHRGVGSDGILALAGSTSADAGLRILNPDGSEAEKSGNGVRIFARWLVEEGHVPGDRSRSRRPAASSRVASTA